MAATFSSQLANTKKSAETRYSNLLITSGIGLFSFFFNFPAPIDYLPRLCPCHLHDGNGPLKNPCKKGSCGKCIKFSPCWLGPLDYSALLETDETLELFAREEEKMCHNLHICHVAAVSGCPVGGGKSLKKKGQEEEAIERLSLRQPERQP